MLHPAGQQTMDVKACLFMMVGRHDIPDVTLVTLPRLSNSWFFRKLVLQGCLKAAGISLLSYDFHILSRSFPME